MRKNDGSKIDCRTEEIIIRRFKGKLTLSLIEITEQLKSMYSVEFSRGGVSTLLQKHINDLLHDGSEINIEEVELITDKFIAHLINAISRIRKDVEKAFVVEISDKETKAILQSYINNFIIE